MNKKILLAIGILGIVMVSLIVTAAITFDKKDFTKKVKEIDNKKICEKEESMKVKFKKCKGNEKKLKIDEGFIFQDLEGRYMID